MESPPRTGVVIAPMGVGQVIDRGIDLARRNYRFLLTTSAWGLVPAALAYAFASALIASGGSPSPNIIVLAGAGFVAYGFGVALTSTAVVLACARLIDPTENPRDTTPGELYWTALTRIGWQILLAIVATFSFLLFIIPPLGMWVWLRWSQSWTAVIIEGRGPISAIRRSWQLTQRAWWHAFVALFAAGLISSVLGFVVGALAAAVAGGIGFVSGNQAVTAAVNALVSTAASTLVEPFSVPIIVVLFYELRARSEGFDLEQRAHLLAPQP